jgi:hypothetical protein
MPRPRHLSLAILVIGIMLGVGATPAAAQEDQEELSLPAIDGTVQGHLRSDDIVVLDDESFCTYMLASLWGTDELTFSRLLDRTKRQKKARRAAFQPASDTDVLTRCVAVLNAYRDRSAIEDDLPSWARESAVLPAALARFLPTDATTALADPPPPTDGARTEGFGSRQSAPFTLFGGAYYIEPSTEGCASWTGAIRQADAPDNVLATVDGPLNLYDVELGTWFWDVTAPDCDWSVDISPLVIVEATPTPRPTATVPQLVGVDPWNPTDGSQNDDWLTVEAAKAALDAAGLVVGACTEAFEFPYSPGRVIGQEPAPGTVVELGSAVNVTVREPGCAVLTGTG